MITGDLVSGFYWDMQKEHVEFWRHYHAKFMYMMNELEIPWAFVPGGRDFEADVD